MARSGPRLAAVAAFFVALTACGGSGTPAPQTDIGITSTSILLGNTIPQTGGANLYATIADAESAYFTYVNGQGGVNGRQIQFKVVDDGYDSSKTVPLTKGLVEQDQVFAMFSGLGTQTQTSVRDYLNGKKVPQLFVATGATTFDLNYSTNKWTLGWQPPYQAESQIYAKDLILNHPNAKVGVLYQNDDYGLDYLKGLTDGLGSHASMIVAKQSFDVTAANPFAQLAQLKNTNNVDTLFLFATPTPAIQSLVYITLGLRWAPTIYLNGVSNPAVFMRVAKSKGAALQNLTTVAYLKDPTDPQWAGDSGMQLYKTIIANCSKCDPNNGLNIYGVAVAYTMVDVLKQAGTQMTRANVMNIAANQLNETSPFLLPGVKVHTTSSDHFPITQEQVATWNGTGWTLQGSLIDSRGTIK
jgi:branched-chain amino acid transport system substrate-binding protein